MTLEALKKAGIQFSFCRYAVVPEIPRVQDVMFALRLSREQEYYEFCLWNHSVYIGNIGLVIAAVSHQVLNQERYYESAARRFIARAIVDLCPETAKCLFVSAYVQALEIAGETPPPKSASRDTLIAACHCPEHRASAAQD